MWGICSAAEPVAKGPKAIQGATAPLKPRRQLSCYWGDVHDPGGV